MSRCKGKSDKRGSKYPSKEDKIPTWDNMRKTQGAKSKKDKSATFSSFFKGRSKSSKIRPEPGDEINQLRKSIKTKIHDLQQYFMSGEQENIPPYHTTDKTRKHLRAADKAISSCLRELAKTPGRECKRPPTFSPWHHSSEETGIETNDVVSNTEIELDPIALREKNMKLKEELRKYEMENGDLKARLGENMVHNIAMDHTLEDVSQANRPLALRDKYEHICSAEWMHAKEGLDELFSSESTKDTKFIILCEIYKSAHARMKSELEHLFYKLQQPLSQDSNKECRKPQKNRLPQTMKNNICDYLLSQAGNIDVESSVQPILEHALEVVWKSTKQTSAPKKRDFLQHLQRSASSQAFVRSVSSLCWAMVIQHVPLEFSTFGIDKPFNPATQKLFYSCTVQKGSVVKYYIHPAIYHGDKLLQQGLVFVSE